MYFRGSSSIAGVGTSAMVKPPVRLLIRDQFAFRPSGSTTAALVDLLQTTPDLLLQHEHVVIFSFDFTRALDRVNHYALSQKLLLLDMPDQIYNWMIDFFRDRDHSA